MYIIISLSSICVSHCNCFPLHNKSSFRFTQETGCIPGKMTMPQAGKPTKCGPIPNTGLALLCSPKCLELLLNHPTLSFNRCQELFPTKVTKHKADHACLLQLHLQPYICLDSMTAWCLIQPKNITVTTSFDWLLSM